MVSGSSDYRKAYDSAKRELAELIASEDRLQKRKIELRKTIEVLGTLCESEEIPIEPSPEATYLLEHSTLADEIRGLLKSRSPHGLRPSSIKMDLERLGCDLTKYTNSQSTIQMVLKRMCDSGEVEEAEDKEGKKVYGMPTLAQRIEARPKPIPAPIAGPKRAPRS